ncbi:MAG: glycosyltransferase family 4 protein [Verrucomicrobia bacterium]|nr:glycosyltransferase family 4 protein [Verrucomicrobiota bacterium]
MRIGLSTSVIQRGQTGVAQYVFGLVRALTQLQSHHEFVLFVLEEDLPLFAFAEPRVELVAVSERFRPPVKNILWHQACLPRQVRAHRLEVLHVPSYRRLLWPRPCVLVATIHDLAPFRVRRKYDWARMFYGRVVARQLARRQDALITVSQNTARDVGTHFGLPASRLTVVHNGIDHARFYPGDPVRAKASVAARHGLRAPFFLYVARVEHPAKNHWRLLEAFDRFKAQTNSSWQLVFAGSDWHGAPMVHARIRASPFAADIRCLGFVPDPDLPDLFRAAGVFVYPSLYEGFGIPPIEAMACGCPVLCSTRGALGEVVGSAAAATDPEDIPGLQRQLTRLASDAGLRDFLRAAGLRQARLFDWETAAAATLEVYERAAAQVRQTRGLTPLRSVASGS